MKNWAHIFKGFMRFVELTTAQDVELLMDKLPAEFSLDTEYTHADPLARGVPDSRTARLLSIVISPDGEVGYSIPASYVGFLKPLAKASCLYLQNFKVEYEILGRYGVDLTETPFYDSMLLHHLIDENAEHSLDYMVRTYHADTYKTDFWEKYSSIDQAPKAERLEYECKDAVYTYRLCKTFLGYLNERKALADHTHALALELFFTERDGLPVDLPLILQTKEEMGAEIEQIFPAMRAEFLPHCQAWEMGKWVGRLAAYKTERGRANCPPPNPFNFGSDAQISWLLYEELKLPVLKTTKRTPKGGGGNPSVDYETLAMLKEKGHDLGSLMRYKEIKNLYGTFVLGLLERVEDGKIYPAFNTNGTATGRISHSNPNMGNMPKDGPYRNFFLPNRGLVLFGADYSQLEIIVEANLTGDKNTVRIVKEGASKHDITAQELGIKREDAKTLNFAMGYRCTPWRVKHILKCSDKDAEHLWNRYWETYKGVRDLQKICDDKIAHGEPIVTPFGRERHFPESFETDRDRGRAQRQAYNALIQGTGADCMNIAFAVAAKRMRRTGAGRMLFTVHDEGLGETTPDRVEEQKTLLIKDMESLSSLLKFELPLKAVAYGPLDKWAKA
jgi:DNA polymerase I-like protein with 3'-5' exonuclease and polymerase domains